MRSFYLGLRPWTVGRLTGLLVAAAANLFAMIPAAPAETVQSVIAVVNDEPISRYDLEQRMRLVLSSAGSRPSDETIRRIEPQVLRSLVDEHLQLQEAKKQKISVSDDELDQAIGMIAQQNNMAPGQIEKFMSQGNIDMATLREQIRAEMAWQRLVSERFGGRVYVSEGDLKTEYDRFANAMTHPQYLVSEILLPIDNPDQEEEVGNSARGILADLKRGAPFASLARQFSKASSAAAGGDLGWVQTGQLDSTLDSVITSLTPGQVSEPIRTAGGYHILMVRSKREAGTTGVGELKRVHMKQIVLPLAAKPSPAELEKAEQKAAEISSNISSCAGVDRLKSDPTLNITDYGDLAAESIAPQMRQAIANLEVGQASPPLRGNLGMAILVVCSKDTGPAPKAQMPTMEDVQNRMINQQLSMMSRRYLRDLRRDAVVDYRVPQVN